MNFHSFPAFSLSGDKNFDFTISNSSPGPKYLLGSTIDPKKSTKFGFSKRSVMGISETPAPIAYQKPTYISEHQKITIPKTVRQQIDYENINKPGPGFYQPSDQLVRSKSSSYGIAYKYQSVFTDKSGKPGPGDYNPGLKTATESKVSKFATSERPFQGKDPKLPGPGQYETAKSTLEINKQVIGNQNRFNSTKESFPGPGEYNPVVQASSTEKLKKGFTLSDKLWVKNYDTSQDNPGPQYNLNPIENKISYSIGKAERTNAELHKKTKSPGPADYNLKIDQILKKSSSATIPKSTLKQISPFIENPGPGSYEIIPKPIQQLSQRLMPGAQFSRSKSVTVYSNSKNPSPADYRIEHIFESKKSIKIGNSNRTNFINKNKSGPGDYNIGGNMLKSNAITIPKQPRKMVVNQNPGPSHYLLAATISNLNKYSLYKPGVAEQ